MPRVSDEESFFETLRLNWPRCTDGTLVQVGDVVDVSRIGRLRVVELKVFGGTSFALNGFWVGGLEIRRVPSRARGANASFGPMDEVGGE